MDYLVIEGFKSAAETFSTEANIPPTVDLNSIESRMSIREALQRGDIEDAITRVNDLNPEVGGFTLLFSRQQTSASSMLHNNRSWTQILRYSSICSSNG